VRITVRADTPERLTFHLRPVKLTAYYGFGVLFVLLGMWTGWMLCRSLDFVCERGPRGVCTRRQRVLLFQDSRAVAVTALRGARVVPVTSGISASMEIRAETAEGELPLPLVGAGGVEKDSIARAMNAFVRDTSIARLAVHEDKRAVGLLFALFLAGAGALCIVAVERVVCDFDRRTGTVRIRGIGITGVRRVDLPLERVAGVKSEVLATRRTRSWQVLLKVTGGVPVGLTRMAMFTDQSRDQVIGLVERFLGAARH
jgi:hypothetical protein